jgi:WD40 repeat protein
VDAWRLAKCRQRLHHRLPLIGGWLQRRAVRALVADGSPAALDVLTTTVAQGPDELGRARALEALGRLDSQNGVDAVARAWAATRHPQLEGLLRQRGVLPGAPPAVRLLTALKLSRHDLLLDLPADEVGHLAAALEDRDAQVREEALRLAGGLRDPAARAALTDPLCALWASERTPGLEALVVAGRLLASGPLPVRLLSALKTGQEGLLRESGAEVVQPLAAACADADPEVASRAKRLLRELQHPDAADAVCRHFLDTDDAQARAAALEAGYLPREEPLRALFLFLTEQWAAYEALDFDRRLLHAAFEAADAGLRQRIAEKVRAAGRTDFLTVLAGSDYRSRAGRMTAGEADVLVHLLTANREWAKLWALAFELPLRSSLRIVRELTRRSWRPEHEDERAVLERLAVLAADGKLDEKALAAKLPPAVLRARARVPGRANDVAFSPRRPLIAVATGRGKVVLWNYQKGEREEVHGGFGHAVGRVAFSAADTLLCCERGLAGGKPLPLHGWRDGRRLSLTPPGTITALEALTGEQMLLADRAGQVALFDAGEWRVAAGKQFPFWCRALRPGPDGRTAALLHEGVALVGLPDLNELAATTSRDLRGVVTCASFAADDELVVGKHRGPVETLRREGEMLRRGKVLLRHDAAVRAVEVLARRSAVLTAAADGTLVFTAWANRAELGRLRAEGGRLTSLHVAPGGDFMAVGDSDSAMSLWDLRVLEVPLLLSRPFATALPVHLAAVAALLGDGGVPAEVGQALRFVQCVLQHRFRYDIELDELPAIRAGEFDIEIEG